MENPEFSAAIAENESRILAMGFKLNKSNVDENHRQYRRDNFAISIDTERYSNDINISIYYIFSDDIKRNDEQFAYDVSKLFPLLNQTLWEKYRSVPLLDYKANISFFVDFIEKYGDIIFRFPLPEPLLSQYRNRMKADPLYDLTDSIDPLALGYFPPES